MLFFIQNMLSLHAGFAYAPPSLRSLHSVAEDVVRRDIAQLPPWQDLCNGAQADSEPADCEDDEFRHGWQFKLSSAYESVSSNEFLESLPSGPRACLRSSAGAHASTWLLAMPRANNLSLDDAEFRVAMLRRLHMPVNATYDTCGRCRRVVDAYGFHRSTCMQTGLVHSRHKYLVSTWRDVFREAGINIPQRNVERFLGRTHITNNLADRRRMDLITPGITGVFGGKPLFMDATCVSPVHGDGTPMPHAADNDGARASAKDEETRETDYPDVQRSPHAHLLSLSVETYGRWGPDSLQLVRQLAKYKNAQHTEILQQSITLAYSKRWWSLLSVALQKAIAGAILRQEGGDLTEACETVALLPLDELLDLHR